MEICILSPGRRQHPLKVDNDRAKSRILNGISQYFPIDRFILDKLKAIINTKISPLK